jgi:hypothetical protein
MKCKPDPRLCSTFRSCGLTDGHADMASSSMNFILGIYEYLLSVYLSEFVYFFQVGGWKKDWRPSSVKSYSIIVAKSKEEKTGWSLGNRQIWQNLLRKAMAKNDCFVGDDNSYIYLKFVSEFKDSVISSGYITSRILFKGHAEHVHCVPYIAECCWWRFLLSAMTSTNRRGN